MCKMYCTDTYQGHNRLLCRLANCVPIDIQVNQSRSRSVSPHYVIVPISRFSERGYGKMCGDWNRIYQNAWGLQIYIKMGGDCVGIAWGRKNNIHFVWGWRGAPHTRFCRVGSSPHNPHARFSQWGLCGADLRGWVRQGCHIWNRRNFSNFLSIFSRILFSFSLRGLKFVRLIFGTS